MTDLPITRDHVDLLVPTEGLSPLDAWTAIKTVLRNKLGEQDWEMWIRHARLMRHSPRKLSWRAALLVSVPRKDRAIIGAMRNTREVKRLARKLNFEIALAIEPADPVQAARLTYLEPAPSELWGQG